MLTANCVVIVPARARILILDNRTTGSFTLTVKTAAGTGVVVPQGIRAHTYSDGLNVYLVSDSASAGAALPVASESVQGISRFGTDAEDIAGVLRSVSVHPAGLKAALDARPPAPAATTTVAGIAALATSTEGLTGTNNTKIVTPAVLQAKMNALPLATDTVVGLVERATSAETITGTDPSRYVTPATLKAVVDTLPVTPITGTPLTVLRIAASGTGQEAATGVTVDASGQLGIGTPSPATALTLQGDTFAAGQIQQISYNDAVGNPGVILRRGRGTVAAPLKVQAGDFSGVLSLQSWSRNTANTADAWVQMALLRAEVEQVDAQERAGGRLTLWTAPAGSGAVVERLRLDASGNLSTASSVAGTGLTRGLVLETGTPPTAAHPATAVQAWVQLRGGVATRYGLHLRNPDGSGQVFSNAVGLGTLCDGTVGSGAVYRELNVSGSQLYVRASSVQERAIALIDTSWPTPTDASRKGRLTISAYDHLAAREGLRIEASGAASMLSFHGVSAVLRQVIAAAGTDATSVQALVNSIRTALINYGLCV